MKRSAIAWASPNIALVKYWGKAPGKDNKPAAGSLSMTLSNIGARTEVRFDDALPEDKLLLNGQEDEATLVRVSRCLDVIRTLQKENSKAEVVSENNFPTGAGLASSAAGFAALTVAADAALNAGLTAAELSRIARRASGSAARSIWGGYVLLPADTADPTAEPLFDEAHFPLDVVIAVVSKEAKAIGSTEGMISTEQTSDYYAAWIDNQPKDLASAQQALAERDFQKLAAVAEASCLKMHAVMLATRPGLLYWAPATVACLHEIRSLQNEGVAVFFTIDAGPQVKAFCLPEASDKVAQRLADVTGVLEIIRTSTGADALVLVEAK